MPAEENKIVTTTKASLELDPLFKIDKSGDGEIDPLLSGSVGGKSVGYKRPFIQINGERVDNGLQYFNLNTSGFLPVCTFTFNVLSETFMVKSYPKDGDIVSIYIRSVGEVYKPIRMDFNIISVSGLTRPNGKANSKGSYQTFTIISECRIPGIYTQRMKSFPQSTSHDVLLAVSQDLGLGFASNNSDMDDIMTWVCPNFSYYDFIKEVSSRSYKDDYSYFDTWVDLYYNLNFVNLGSQYGVTKMDNPETVRFPVSKSDTPIPVSDDSVAKDISQNIEEFKLILSNADSITKYPVYIRAFTLVSNSGQMTNKSGYINRIGIYDSDITDGEFSTGYVRYEIESITVEDISQNTLLQKGRPLENLYNQEIRSYWQGENVTGEEAQTHPNYLHAPIQNVLNLDDSSKFILRVEFNQFNPFIYKGQVIPVVIFTYEPGLGLENSGESQVDSGKGKSEPKRNLFLSGTYVVMDFDIDYSPGGEITQTVSLGRKTWNINTSGDLPRYYPASNESGYG